MKNFKMITGIVCGLILTISPVMASGLDLSEKSVEELLEIRKEVDEALFNAGGFVQVPFGRYVVGADIGSGMYNIQTFKSKAEDEERDYGLTVQVFRNEEMEKTYMPAYTEHISSLLSDDKEKTDFNEADYLSFSIELGNVDAAHFSLSDGEILVLTDSSVQYPAVVVMSKQTGLFMD